MLLSYIMNFLLWNIRGIGKGEKCTTIRNLVVENKINFLGLVETKHRNSIKSRLKGMRGSHNFAFCECFASDTHAGGYYYSLGSCKI